MPAPIAAPQRRSISQVHCNPLSQGVNERHVDVGSVPMDPADGRERMLQRHEIVVRIIEANSRRLHLENEINGLDIERRIAERDLIAKPDDYEIRARLTGIETKMEASRGESVRLENERDWLDRSLAEFDGAPPADHRPHGRA